jgi:hypothetical protein
MESSNDVWRLVATLFGAAMKNPQDFPGPDKTESFYESLDANVLNVDWLKSNKRILTEMVLVRIADNFLAYLTDLLRLVMTARPETILAEKGKLDIRQVLEAASLDDLKKEIVEDRILAISYKSVADLAAHLRSQLGFDVFASQVAQGIVVKTVEARNIIVHNRSRINQRYVDRAGGKKEEIGRPLEVQASDLLRMNGYFESLAREIDQAAIEKFNLPSSSRGF